MESSVDPAEQILQVERAEAAPYVNLAPARWWFAPSFGLWFAAYVLAFTLWRDHQIAFIVVMIALSAGLGAFVGWMTQTYGAFPTPGRGTPPPEIRSEYRRYFTGALAAAAIVAATWWWAGLIVAAVTAFAVVTAGLALYQVRYERAASAVRERLK